MLSHTNVLSTNQTTRRMYKIQAFSRNSHGNKKDLLFTSLYKSRIEANEAKVALIRLSKGSNFAPVDIECQKAGRSKYAVFDTSGFIVSEVTKE